MKLQFLPLAVSRFGWLRKSSEEKALKCKLQPQNRRYSSGSESLKKVEHGIDGRIQNIQFISRSLTEPIANLAGDISLNSG